MRLARLPDCRRMRASPDHFRASRRGAFFLLDMEGSRDRQRSRVVSSEGRTDLVEVFDRLGVLEDAFRGGLHLLTGGPSMVIVAPLVGWNP